MSASDRCARSLLAVAFWGIAFLRGRLSYLAARRDRPGDLDRAVPDAVDLVHHVGDDAAMIGHHVDDVTHLRALGAGGEVDGAVLFREARHGSLGILHHVSVALHEV